MAWQKHGNQWYYHKRMKRDGKGYQIYLGRGEAAYAEEAAVAQRKVIREVNRQMSGLAKTITKPVRDLARYTDQLTRAVLLGSGFKEHHREWRRTTNVPPQHN